MSLILKKVVNSLPPTVIPVFLKKKVFGTRFNFVNRPKGTILTSSSSSFLFEIKFHYLQLGTFSMHIKISKDLQHSDWELVTITTNLRQKSKKRNVESFQFKILYIVNMFCAFNNKISMLSFQCRRANVVVKNQRYDQTLSQ